MTRSTRIGLSALLAGAWLSTAAMPAHAGWSESGVPIPAGSRPATYFRGVTDGAGGILLAHWYRQGAFAGFPTCRRLLANGEPAPGWPAALDAETTSNWEREAVDIAPDGGGGAYVAWSGASQNPRVQHLLADGSTHPSWPANGKPVTSWLGGACSPRIASDGEGGALLAWLAYPDSIHLLRLQADGTPAPGWPPRGLLVNSPAGNVISPFVDLLPAGGGGVFACWADTAQVFVQSVLGDGTLAPGWPAGGVGIASGSIDAATPARLLPSPGDYLQVHWKRVQGEVVSTAAPGELVTMRLTAAGAPAPGWPDAGKSVFASDSAFSQPAVMSDGAGGSLLAWSLRSDGDVELRVLRLGVDGDPAGGWSPGGLSVAEPPAEFLGLQYLHLFRDLGFAATTDGSGGAIVSWNDGRSGEFSVRAAHVLGSGVVNPSWPAAGLNVTPLDWGWSLELLPVGAGGAIAIWNADAYTAGDCRASRIEAGVVVPVQVSLAAAEAIPGGAKLAWVVTQLGAARVTIERRVGDAAWQPLATLAPDGTGRIAYEDSGLAPGARVSYRLAYDDAGTPRTAGEVTLVIPGHAAFGIAGVSPNPAGSEVTLRFALESGAPARLELYDAGGRRVRGAAVAAVPGTAATHRFDRLDLLPPGVYHARLSQGDRSDAVRLTVLR